MLKILTERESKEIKLNYLYNHDLEIKVSPVSTGYINWLYQNQANSYKKRGIDCEAVLNHIIQQTRYHYASNDTNQYNSNLLNVKVPATNVLEPSTREDGAASSDEDGTQRKDLQTIRRFFHDFQAVFAQLERLNRKLESLAGMTSVLNLLLLPYADVTHKLLSAFFKKWAVDNGFSGIEKVKANLSTEEFLEKLAEGKLIKDKFFGGTPHGEWTHFIQWWCLVEANKQNKFLTNPPSELLRWIGTHQAAIEWLVTFEIDVDRIPGCNDVFMMHHCLFNPTLAPRFPLLQTLLQQQDAKRRMPSDILKPSSSTRDNLQRDDNKQNISFSAKP